MKRIIPPEIDGIRPSTESPRLLPPAEKDRQLAVHVLRAVVVHGMGKPVRKLSGFLTRGWRPAIRKALKKAEADDLRDILDFVGRLRP